MKIILSYLVSFLLIINGDHTFDREGIKYLSKEPNEATILISEISYSKTEDGFLLNYLEITNIVSQHYDLKSFSIELESDSAVHSLNIPSNLVMLYEGYLLFSFNKEIITPLPDSVQESIIFSSYISIKLMFTAADKSISTQDQFSLMLSGDGFIIDEQIEKGVIERVQEYGNYINSGDNSKDFNYSAGSPINSALGVGHYIMAETISGQAKYKYPIAKSMISLLTPEQKNYFKNDTSQFMKDTRQRYINWANSEGDYDPYNEGIIEPPKPINNKLIIVAIVGFLSVSLIAILIMQSRKREKNNKSHSF